MSKIIEAPASTNKRVSFQIFMTFFFFSFVGIGKQMDLFVNHNKTQKFIVGGRIHSKGMCHPQYYALLSMQSKIIIP